MSRDLSIAKQKIREEENFSETAYICPAGKWTVGYGQTKGVTENSRMTREEAEADLDRTVREVAAQIEKLVKVPLTDNQFNALVLFVYNAGAGNFASSTLLRKLNEGKYEEAAEEFPRWVYANGKVSRGLINRRAREREMFLTP